MDRIDFNPKFAQHSRIIVCGSSNTGKSHLIHKFITFRDQVFSENISFVLYFYLLKNEKVFSEIESVVDAEFHEGISNLHEILEKHQSKFKKQSTLVIIEDLQLEAYNSETVCKLFCAYTHHFPLAAVIMSVQSPYQKTCKYTTVINRNTSHFIFSASKRIRGILPFLGREIFPSSPQKLLSVFDEAMKGDEGSESYPYLICFPDSPNDKTIFYSNILPNEKLKIFI